MCCAMGRSHGRNGAGRNVATKNKTPTSGDNEVNHIDINKLRRTVGMGWMMPVRGLILSN